MSSRIKFGVFDFTNKLHLCDFRDYDEAKSFCTEYVAHYHWVHGVDKPVDILVQRSESVDTY